MKDIGLITIAKRKEESRKIVKEIIDFGVTEEQKIDIVFNIIMTLESRDAMQEIGNVIKKYNTKVNKDREEDIIPIKNKKVILTWRSKNEQWTIRSIRNIKNTCWVFTKRYRKAFTRKQVSRTQGTKRLEGD